jgi:hypothetical protein
MLSHLKKLWFDLNYRYCMSNAYLARSRYDIIDAVRWTDKAWHWKQSLRRMQWN